MMITMSNRRIAKSTAVSLQRQGAGPYYMCALSGLLALRLPKPTLRVECVELHQLLDKLPIVRTRPGRGAFPCSAILAGPLQPLPRVPVVANCGKGKY